MRPTSLVLAAVAAVVLAAGCAGSTPPASTTGASSATPSLAAAISTPTSTVSAAVSATSTPGASGTPATATGPSPVCGHRPPPAWVTSAKSPNDGVPDPAGRIVFSPVDHYNEILGQIVDPLVAIDPDGSDLVQLLDCQIDRPRFSPDGRRIVFSIVMDDQSKQVATIRADGTGLRILTAVPGYAQDPVWSPDGTWILYSLAGHCASMPACVEDGTDRPALWRMNADGSNQQEFGPPGTIDVEPFFSPDGNQVVFDRSDPTHDFAFHFVIRDLATGKERRVLTAQRELEHPAWSPDGRWIIYNTLSDGNGNSLEQIERMPANNPDAKPDVLTGDAAHPSYKPNYSPDGSAIVFGCGGRVCEMAADGSHVKEILAVAGLDLNHFSWGVQPKATP